LFSDYLYPFGPEAGDKTAPPSDDGCNILIDHNIVMFEREYSRLYV